MKLKFKDIETNKEILEEVIQRDESLFANQYVIADNILSEHMSEAGRSNLRFNNVIAFCGDRGSGKSSCMKSFIQQKKAQTELKLVYLDTIDPSFFDDSHNILELVIGRLYGKIANHSVGEDEDDTLRDKRNKLLLKFDGVMRDLKFLAKAEDRERFYDSLQELDALSVGVNLQAKIAGLIDECLNFLGDFNFLIISIDDLDLNINQGYIMSEHIRKYLTNDKCIILIGVKVDQLIECVKNSLSRTSAISSDEAYEMAVKYVAKLIPVGYRVNMPVLDDYRKIELDYSCGDNTISFHSVQEAVTHQIFWKTGYLFYNSKGSNSYIVPDNLRSLRQLLHLLSSMDIHDRNSPEMLHSNQKIFKRYFFNTWTQQLDADGRLTVKKLIDNIDVQSFNKHVIDILNAMQDSASDSFNLHQYAYNITMGDVMAELMKMEQTETDHQNRLLLFFIRTLCSMQMYESYDFVTENIDTELFPSEVAGGVGEIYSTDALFSTTNKMQRIINGRYFSFRRNEVLPYRQKEENPRDFLLIDGQKLGDELKVLGSRIENLSEDDKKHFSVLEYFILSISRFAILKRKTDDYQVLPITSDPVYLTSFNYGTKNLVYDVLSPFFNIINLKTTYNRFNDSFQNGNRDCPDLYDYLESKEWSLLHKLITRNCRDYQKDIHGLLSDAVIRNGEVLTAITERIRANRNRRYKSSENCKLLAEFYKSIMDTGMNTYPRNPLERPYEIEFDFLKQICAVLNECDTNYFDAIYVKPEDADEDAVNVADIFIRATYRQSTILRKLKDNLHDLYGSKSPAGWKGLFPAGMDIPREQIIGILQDNIG